MKQTLTWRKEMLRSKKVEIMTAVAVYIIYYVGCYGVLSIVADISGWDMPWTWWASTVISGGISYWDWKTK